MPRGDAKVMGGIPKAGVEVDGKVHRPFIGTVVPVPNPEASDLERICTHARLRVDTRNATGNSGSEQRSGTWAGVGDEGDAHSISSATSALISRGVGRSANLPARVSRQGV